MCGCTFVCSDPPCCLGLQDKHNTHQVLGGKVVKRLHGDDLQQTSPCPLLQLMMLATALGYPCTANREAQADTQWGIEAEAILQRGLHHTQVGWEGLVQKTDRAAVSWG